MVKRNGILKILLVLLVTATGVSLYLGWDRSRSKYRADLIASLDPNEMCDVKCGVCDNVFQMNLRDYTEKIAQENEDGGFITCPQCNAPQCLRVCEGGAVVPLPPGYPTWVPEGESVDSESDSEPRASGLPGTFLRGPKAEKDGE